MPPRYVKPLICLLLILSTVAVYGQLKDHGFLKIDDPEYVIENYSIHHGLTLKVVAWSFATNHAANWHPLTWLSHLLDYQLYGLNPRGHNLTNLALHVANTVLLFLLLVKLTAALWPSALVAALFALHPLHVESVAWVAERKDVLSAFFFLTTIWAYAWYTEAPSLRRYLPVFLSFALGLMAKPMLVTLPFVLLLLDYWPLGRLAPAAPAAGKRGGAPPPAFRWSRQQILPLIWEKVPLLALTAASCALTIVAQKKAMAPLTLTLGSRIGNALVAYVLYLGKTLWPLNLAVFYPHPENCLPLWQAVGAGLLLGGCTYLVLKMAGRHPYLLLGWFWYLGTLVPVIGLVQVGAQAMADRYTYIPLVGIFIILAWGAADLTASWRRRRLVLALAAGVLLPLLMVLAWVQTGYWRNTLLLFEHAARVTENNYSAYQLLIDLYGEKGRLAEAVSMFRNTIRIRPGYAEAYNSMGNAYAKQDMVAEAIAMYREAIRLKPEFARAYNSLGIDLGRQGNLDEAIAALKKAIDLKPDFSEAYCNLGIAYALQGKRQEAMAMFQEAVKINPGNDGALKMLNLVKQNAGN